MLVTFQHPIIDFRSLYENTYKLSIPVWPIPDEELMIKFFGQTKRRKKGGTANWSGEHKFCSSRKAIRLPNLDRYRIKLGEGFLLATEGAFRRLNANGNFLVKLEIGLANPIENFLTKIPLNEDSFEKLLLDTSNIEVQIRNPLGDNITSRISTCSKVVSELYLYSTSSSIGLKGNKLEKKWITHGEPLCIVEYTDFENKLIIPKGAKLIARYSSPEIELYHYWIYLPNKKKIRTWIIKKLNYYDYDDCKLRDLRLNLLRINAEKETVRKLLNLLQNSDIEFGTGKERFTTVSNYLKLVSSKLLKDIRYRINQEDILDVALCAEDKAQPGELESYMEALSSLNNKYIINNIEQIVSKGLVINVTGGEIHEINITENGNIIKNGNKN